MRLVSFVVVSMFAIGCSSDDVGDAVFAVDVDQSGAVDCADLDHVIACVQHPDPHACAHADVNGDGVVDDADIHDIQAGLHATHHECPAP